MNMPAYDSCPINSFAIKAGDMSEAFTTARTVLERRRRAGDSGKVHRAERPERQRVKPPQRGHELFSLLLSLMKM